LRKEEGKNGKREEGGVNQGHDIQIDPNGGRGSHLGKGGGTMMQVSQSHGVMLCRNKRKGNWRRKSEHKKIGGKGTKTNEMPKDARNPPKITRHWAYWLDHGKVPSREKRKMKKRCCKGNNNHIL